MSGLHTNLLIIIFIYLADGWPNTVFWLENSEGVLDGVLLTAKGLAGGEKLAADWDGLHACCPKRDMLPNADPGELNPMEDWPNDDGWLAAAATDPKSPLDAAVVDGVPNMDVVVLVAAGVPKIDEVVDVEPNTELDDAGIDGLPNIDELVEAGEPKTVAAWAGDPKPPVFVVADPKIEDAVVAEGVPNNDEVVVFKELPNIDWDVVEVEVPKIEDVVIALLCAPNMEDAVVAFIDAPNTAGAVFVFAGIPKIVDALVALVEVLKIEEVLVVLVGVLKIEEVLVVFVGVLKIVVPLVVLVGVLKIEGALAKLVGVLKIDFGPVVLVIQSVIVAVVVEQIGATKTVVLVDEISKTGVLMAVVGVEAFSLSGVTGSDIIGVGVSESWVVGSVTILPGATEEVLMPGVVLTFPKVEDMVGEPTGSVTTEGRVFVGSEKLNDADIAVEGVDVKRDLVSGNVLGLETSFLGTEKLKDETDAVSDFELKLKDTGASLAGSVSCLLFDLSSPASAENIPGVSKGLDNILGISKLKLLGCASFGSLILFFIESAKLKVIGKLVFGTDVSILVAETLVKLKGVFSLDSVVPEIISKVDFVETVLRTLEKLKGTVVDGFKPKSTGSLLDVLPIVILLPNNEVELAALKTTESLGTDL